MSSFKLHTLDSTPAGSLPILDAVNKGLGFIPNLYAHLAESPATLQAYKQLSAQLEQSAFTPEEQQAILITVSVENRDLPEAQRIWLRSRTIEEAIKEVMQRACGTIEFGCNGGSFFIFPDQSGFWFAVHPEQGSPPPF